MSYTIDYQIKNLEVTTSLNNHTDVITKIYFTITVAEDGFSSVYEDWVPLTPSNEFIDFENVSKNTVINWLKSVLWQGPNTEAVFIQQRLNLIQKLKNPTIIQKVPSNWIEVL
jgi:hypothetical protein